MNLIDRQAEAADQQLGAIDEIAERMGAMPGQIELGVSSDDYEARTLGWPSTSAHWAVVARVIAEAPPDVEVRVVPRGSTVATAAAIEAHEKARNS